MLYISPGLVEDRNKPLEVVLTHLHFDHTGGAHQFDKVDMHKSEAAFLRNGNNFMMSSWVIPKVSCNVQLPKLARGLTFRLLDIISLFSI